MPLPAARADIAKLRRNPLQYRGEWPLPCAGIAAALPARQTLAVAAVLASAPTGGALSGEALLLGLGSEETAVLQLAQDAGVLYRSPKAIDQALGAFALAGGNVSHANLPFVVQIV